MYSEDKPCHLSGPSVSVIQLIVSTEFNSTSYFVCDILKNVNNTEWKMLGTDCLGVRLTL